MQQVEMRNNNIDRIKDREEASLQSQQVQQADSNRALTLPEMSTFDQNLNIPMPLSPLTSLPSLDRYDTDKLNNRINHFIPYHTIPYHTTSANKLTCDRYYYSS